MLWRAFMLLAAALALAPLALVPGTRWGRAVAVFFLAALIGCANIWWKAERTAAPVLKDERLATFTAEVESLQRMPAREAVRIVVKPQDPKLPTRIRINIDQNKPVPASRPGQPCSCAHG